MTSNGKDELREQITAWVLKYGNDFYESIGHKDISEDKYVDAIMWYIAASNQRAVLKARLEEAEYWGRNISQFYAVNDKAVDEIKQFARFRVVDLRHLAAAQPRKDGDE